MKVLAISPHSDDVELGCGGTIARFIREGHEVTVWVMSFGNPQTGATLDEFKGAMNVLGVEKTMYDGFDCREFRVRRQDILQKMIYHQLQHEVDLVLVPSSANIHQDHEVVTAEAMRAFRDCSILGYEMPWGDMRPFNAKFYIYLLSRDMDQKIEAIKQYESQIIRSYTKEGVIRSLAGIHGVSINTPWAEAFEVIRWVM